MIAQEGSAQHHAGDLWKEPKMKSSILKRSIVVAGRKTSVSLEDAFWKDLREIATSQHTTLSDLVDAIDSKRQCGNLSSAIRTFVLEFYRNEIAKREKSESIPLAPK
jgi:predicted DNA-binding ribbon-helix-helix protein